MNIKNRLNAFYLHFLNNSAQSYNVEISVWRVKSIGLNIQVSILLLISHCSLRL